MPLLTRVMLLILAITGGIAAAVVAVTVATGTAWTIGNNDTLLWQSELQASDAVRMQVAAVVGAIGLIILVLGLVAAFARHRTVTLWLGGQHGARVSAEVVERYLRTAIESVKDVEHAKVTAKPAGQRATAVFLDLTVTPDADAAAVTAAAEARVGSMLTSSYAMLLEGHPNITIRHARRRERERRHQVA